MRAEPLSWVMILGNELLDVNTGGLLRKSIMGNQLVMEWWGVSPIGSEFMGPQGSQMQ